MLELIVPQHAVLGQNVSLECNFNLDGEKLYSVKWYKDGNEFYRFVPQEKPPVLVFLHPGVTPIVRITNFPLFLSLSLLFILCVKSKCKTCLEDISLLH